MDRGGLFQSIFPPLFFFSIFFSFSFFVERGKRRNNRLNWLPRDSLFWTVMALPRCASAKARVISFPFLSLPLLEFTARRATSPFPRPGPGPVRSAAPAFPPRCPPAAARAPVRGPELAGVPRPSPRAGVSCSPSPGLGVLFVLKEGAERSLLDWLLNTVHVYWPHPR